MPSETQLHFERDGRVQSLRVAAGLRHRAGCGSLDQTAVDGGGQQSQVCSRWTSFQMWIDDVAAASLRTGECMADLTG